MHVVTAPASVLTPAHPPDRCDHVPDKITDRVGGGVAPPPHTTGHAGPHPAGSPYGRRSTRTTRPGGARCHRPGHVSRRSSRPVRGPWVTVRQPRRPTDRARSGHVNHPPFSPDLFITSEDWRSRHHRPPAPDLHRTVPPVRRRTANTAAVVTQLVTRHRGEPRDDARWPAPSVHQSMARSKLVGVGA